MHTTPTRTARWLRPLLSLAFVLVILAQGMAQVSTYNATGTWVAPTGVTQVTVECWGGGGKGGSRTNDGGGAGAGGGAYVRSVLTVVPGTTYTVTVGGGSTTTGTAGGDSWFGSNTTILAKGGSSPGTNVTTAGAGGSATTSIGTVKFAGGAGAAGSNTDGNNGGGGGSSAGTAATGTTATGSTGATAPTGGGNGGNGRTGTQGDGTDGSAPGGGGGGGKRTSSGTRVGGDGANGRVIVSFNPDGLCMAALAGINAIPDNACMTSIPIAISGQPTVLGTAAGNARLLSVELIINHTYNDDLDITLTSPSGVTRTLSADKGGDSDNMGDPTTCPNTPLILLDGYGTALPNGNTPLLVGTFAPDQSYSAFTGNPNGNWILSICDDANMDTGNLRYVKLNFCTVVTPAVSAAITTGTNPACSGNSITFTATPTNGGGAPTYQWTKNGTNISGATGVTYTGTAGTDFVTGDLIRVVMTSNAACTTTATSTSSPINMTVNSAVTPSVSAGITTGINPTCSGSSVTFTATPTNGGGAPTYQWTKNGTNISGATGVTYTGTAGTDFITGDLIRVVMTSNAACASPTTATSTAITMTVVAPPTSSAAGTDQTACTVPGTATMAANAPGVGTGSWSQTAGPVSAGITTPGSPTTGITGMTTPGTYTFRWTIANSPCTNSTDEVDVVVGVCTYYSRASGNVGDAIWSDTPSGTAGSATFSASSSVVIQSGDVVTVNANTGINDLTVDAGGQLVLAANTLTVSGDLFDIDGSITAADNSTILLNSPGLTTIEASSPMSLFNLTANTPGDVLTDATIAIRGTLLLQDGEFDASLATITLASNASGTGRLGPVSGTAQYTGDMTVQRYIPAGATNWRMMGSPVDGQTVNNWKDDFYTAGFPGSHSPNFASPVGSGILWPSIRWYDESNTGAAVIDGLTGATGTSQSLAPGQGFAAWCGTGFATTTAFTVDVTGEPHVASAPIDLDMSYTSTGNAATDGWNMVSNPLPSPILFSNISRGANVEDYITYFDPATGNNATYDISLGAGTNGGTNTIQSSQGFWLKANGAAVTTSVEESDKVAGNGGGFFGGDEEQVANILRLRINSMMNQYSDETLVVFSEGSPETDGEDVPKFVFAHPEAPQVATQGDDGSLIAINAFGPYSTDISIPVMVNVAVNGDYTITATGLDNVGLSCLRLEDLSNGSITPLTEGATYTFTALADDDETTPRLLIHASAPLVLTPVNASCNGRDDGEASLEVLSGPVDILWMDAEGAVLLEQNNVQAGASGIVALEAGDYQVSVSSPAGCGNLSTAFVIEEPTAIEVTADAMPTSCPDSEDGSIDLMVLGGEAPYTYQWNTGSTESAITVAAGTYTVVITDANNCSIAPQDYVVSAGEGPDAGISVESTTVEVGEELSFFANTVEGVTNTWDFGDGNVVEALEATHSYSEPGTYTVTLTTDDGTCTSTATINIVVETSTGLSTVVGPTLNAWVSGDHIVVDHNFSTDEPVMVRVISTGGQLVQEHRMANAAARITLPTAELATGIWLVRVSSGSHARTFTLPVVH